jgi:hypothetical protein
MKNVLIAALIASAAITSCKKSETVTPSTLASYTVDGLHDVTLTDYYDSYAYSISMPLTITYHDSAQNKVTVSVSEVPNVFIGTYMLGFQSAQASTGPWSGYPSFSIPLFVHVKNQNTYVSGTYPATITVTSGTSTRKYDFNVILK